MLGVLVGGSLLTAIATYMSLRALSPTLLTKQKNIAFPKGATFLPCTQRMRTLSSANYLANVGIADSKINGTLLLMVLNYIGEIIASLHVPVFTFEI